ncbi:MAG: polysaccharide pyruvyl transferase CsaB, partial [Chloroflexota bacterium]
MPHILLAGYLGCGNLGDDAVMLGLLHTLGDEYEPTVLAGNPGETNRRYGVRTVDRRSRKAVQEAIAQADALVFPGGSVFQDATSVRSVAYYTALVRQ